jgi:hypothetical protein
MEKATVQGDRGMVAASPPMRRRRQYRVASRTTSTARSFFKQSEYKRDATR